MNAIYSIKVEWSAAYECIISLYAYIYEKERKHLQLGSAWKEETTRMLPDSFAVELADERWEVLHRLVLLVAQSPRKASVTDFLEWLELIPPGEIYELLAPWVETIPLNLGEIRDHSLSLLKRWNEHYFSKVEPRILESLKQSARETEELAKTLPAIETIDQVTHGIWIEQMNELQEVVLIPQYHCAPTSVLDFHRGIATCLYPVKDAGRLHPQPLLELLPLTQCLADEKRLLILRCLSNGTCTLGELQQQVSLAKSTVHHHVTALRRAGLIRAHYTGSSTIAYYSLRGQFVDRLPVLLRSFLESGGKQQ
ncbi:helix-turn-helix transcriptional regulator [uncultured Brevibacillus sp.]|uniref:ArsR/SmtB family transcription factor n=1 Tax=uncultured Brevibacillus sp. TaxID=169970 RepID=UPI002593EA1B|nr:winged helix-turn-helix domain-containing protein [uncultured Brevibacillus sp.]